MKTVKFFLFAMLLMVLAINTQAQTKKGKGTQEISIKTSAQCEMCKERIETALKATPGVKMADLDLETKAIKVAFNSKKVSADQIRQTIANTGYDADQVAATDKAYKSLPSCCKKGGM